MLSERLENAKPDFSIPVAQWGYLPGASLFPSLDAENSYTTYSSQRPLAEHSGSFENHLS